MKRYTIKRGSHYSATYWGLMMRYFTGRTRALAVGAEFKFTESCLAPSADPLDAQDDDKDRHKLFGVSEQYNPHYNSARIGWAEKDGHIALYTYVYENGVRLKQLLIGKVPINTLCKAWIEYTGISWHFVVQCEGLGRVTVEQPLRAYPQHANNYWLLYPYYGGDYTAPVDTHIYLNHIY